MKITYKRKLDLKEILLFSSISVLILFLLIMSNVVDFIGPIIMLFLITFVAFFTLLSIITGENFFRPIYREFRKKLN